MQAGIFPNAKIRRSHTCARLSARTGRRKRAKTSGGGALACLSERETGGREHEQRIGGNAGHGAPQQRLRLPGNDHHGKRSDERHGALPEAGLELLDREPVSSSVSSISVICGRLLKTA